MLYLFLRWFMRKQSKLLGKNVNEAERERLQEKGWGCLSGEGHLPSMHKAQNLIECLVLLGFSFTSKAPVSCH